MHDVITIGSALVDIFINSNNFALKKETSGGLWLCEQYDEKIEVDSFKVTTGGGGSNTAVGFSRMGFKTGVVAELGVDVWAQVVLNDFKQEGVDTSLLISERKEETGGSIILSAPNGGRTIMVHRGAASMLDERDIPEHVLSQAKWIHLSSISGQIDALRKIFAVVNRSKRQLSWNPGNAEIKLLNSGQFSLVGLSIVVLFVNQKEWQNLAPVHNQLHQQCQQIVVTNSEKGGKVYHAGGINPDEYEGLATKVIDGTGAGDSFAVGYVSAILNGRGLKNQILWGKKNAASVIEKIGAKDGLLTRDQLEKAV
ncbi:carbohydrate kinase family protein [Patescibacteria group bacterium]|nr:carbohydrate kinase family protein [Patescibacteria group bacterium]MBU1885733.1 carbohydrate kinase family protein [Patescibacteria group bacterium]